METVMNFLTVAGVIAMFVRIEHRLTRIETICKTRNGLCGEDNKEET